MPADCPLLRGRTAIDQYYRQWFQGPARVTAFTFSHLESPVLGDTAFDVGTYRQTLSLGAGGTVNVSGKYTRHSETVRRRLEDRLPDLQW